MRVKPLMQFIPALTPRYHEPHHLAPFVDMLERAPNEPVRGLFSFPPRHEKSDTTDHGIARMLLEDPARRVGFATYGQRPAEKRGRRIRDLYQRAGGRILEDASSRTDWRTGAHDGGLWSTSIGGPVTGEGFDVFVIDDPVKDRVTAESPTEREKLADWFRSVAFTRLEPGGSCLVVMARWHADDLIGRLAGEGWPYINLPAIDDDGQALLPQRYPVAALEQIRTTIGEYAWAGLFMGAPRPRGESVFGDVHFFDQLPPQFHVSIGVDLAYSVATRADWSVAVVLAHDEKGTAYLLDVVRAQEEAPRFASRLQGLRATHPGARWRSYLTGTERGVADFVRTLGVDVGAEVPRGDKFIRSMPVSAAWNAGRVLLPRQAHWLGSLVDELKAFTGAKDRHDDQVDALAAAYDAGHDDEGALPEWCSPGFMANAAGAFGGSADIASTLGRKASMPFPGSAPRGPTLTARRHQDGSVELVGNENEWPARFSAHLIDGHARFTLECDRHGQEVADRFRAEVQRWCNSNANRREST